MSLGVKGLNLIDNHPFVLYLFIVFTGVSCQGMSVSLTAPSRQDQGKVVAEVLIKVQALIMAFAKDNLFYFLVFLPLPAQLLFCSKSFLWCMYFQVIVFQTVSTLLVCLFVCVC